MGMAEADLIKKIRILKQIRPRKDWVLLMKKELFKKEAPPFRVYRNPVSVILEIFPRIFHYYKPVLATFVFLGILITGAFSFAQNSLPGDFLFPLKKISEKSQAIFVSEEERPKAQLELANKRLEELTKIAETNQAGKLAPAIEEFQASLSQAAKNLKKPKKLTKEIVAETKKLEENREKIEALGVVVGESEEFDNALSQLVEREVKDLEERTLTDAQQELLEEAAEDFEAKNYSQALEKIWLLSNQ